MIRTFNSEVLEFKYLNPNVIICKFSTPKDFTFKAGQYVSLTVPFEGKKLRRPYSIVSKPSQKESIDLCIKIIKNGPASKFFKTLKVGDDVEFFGPAGKFTINKKSLSKDIVFVSAGTGLTPFISMVGDLLNNGFKNNIILLKGFRNEENCLYDNELLELKKKHSNLEFHNIFSRPKDKDYDDKGYVQDFLKKYIPKDLKSHVYICGLSPMINAVEKKSISLGILKENIFYEKYD